MGSAALNEGRMSGGALDAQPDAASDAASIANNMSFIFDPEHDVEREPRVPIAGADGTWRPEDAHISSGSRRSEEVGLFAGHYCRRNFERQYPGARLGERRKTDGNRLRRGAVGIAADIGGFGVAVMTLGACPINLSRRIRSVLVIAVRVHFRVRGRNEAGDAAGVHRRFGHRHHSRLQRRHDEKQERERGTKPRNSR